MEAVQLVGSAEDVLAVGAGRDVDGHDQRGGLAGDVQAQGTAEGLDAADDGAGGVGKGDRVHACAGHARRHPALFAK